MARLKRRSAWVAGLLSLLAPGLGQVYNTEIIKGLTIFAVFHAIWIGLALLGVTEIFATRAVFVFWLVTLIAMTLWRIALAVGAFRAARPGSPAQLRAINRGLAYGGLVLFSLIVPTLPNFFLDAKTKSVIMQSGSMMPGLLVGDQIVFRIRLREDLLPRRGEVWGYASPTEEQIVYIHRVVGLPGDEIEIAGGALLVNGTDVPRRAAGEFLIAMADGKEEPVNQYSETLSDHEYRVLDIIEGGPADTLGPVDVPEGHYFMLSDNRDQGSDSRFDFVGFVPAEKLMGRAEYVLVSYGSRIDRSQRSSLLGSLRLSRIFLRVE